MKESSQCRVRICIKMDLERGTVESFMPIKLESPQKLLN